VDSPLITNLREGSAGFEFLSAITLLLLALVNVLSTAPTSSVVLFLLRLAFPGPWLTVVIAPGLLHLFALTRWSVYPWILVRKVCSVIGLSIYAGLLWDLYHQGPQVGGMIWMGTIGLFLVVAILRRHYAVL
jgi:hypothetical protein